MHAFQRSHDRVLDSSSYRRVSSLPFNLLGRCSISGNGAHRPDVYKMSAWLDGQLKSLGVTTKLVDLGKHVMDGEELPLPPAILGRIGDDPKKKTVLIYGHYDVQPVSLCRALEQLREDCRPVR